VKPSGLQGPDLAKQVGINKTTLSFYENDKREPDFSVLKAFTAKLEVRAGYLFDEIPELLEKPARIVAASEALRLFAESLPTERKAIAAYERLIELTEAPTTVAGWKAFHKLHRRASGKAE